MDISVIMATWNNNKRLGITLESIAQCRVPEEVSWELIVVNNNCTDDTDSVVGRFIARLPLVYVKEPVQGLSRARNKGLQTAKGKLIIFTDDDVQPAKEWLASYWEAFCRYGQGFYFGGPIESEFESLDFDKDLIPLAPCSVRGFDLNALSGPTNEGKRFMGANWACPAAILKELRGFDESFGLNPVSGRVMTGEESELIRSLNEKGWQGYYVAEARICHYVPADKCRLPHIASRWEAAGEKQAKEIMRTQDFQNRPRMPFWVCKQLVISWIKWALKKVCFQKGYAEYKLLCKYTRLIKVLKSELKEHSARASTSKIYA